MARTLAQLRDEVRQRSDLQSSQFVTDGELTQYLNRSLEKLHDLLVAAREDYFLTVASVTIASGQSSVALPADFYKMRAVDQQIGGQFVRVREFSLAERSHDEPLLRLGRWQTAAVGYRLRANQLVIEPESQAPGVYRIYYVPRATLLLADSDVPSVLDFDEYLVIDSAIKCLAKEESDVSALMVEKAELESRIKEMRGARHAAPARVADVRTRSTYWRR